MTNVEWLSQYDGTKEKFKWFVDYFPGVFDQMEEARAANDAVRIEGLMSKVWFDLPDGRFNIIVDPPGWSDFLYLLEEPPSE